MSSYKLVVICATCNGTGIAPGGGEASETPCPDCNQTGYEWEGTINDLKDDINDLSDKLDDILEKLNE